MVSVATYVANLLYLSFQPLSPLALVFFPFPCHPTDAADDGDARTIGGSHR
jgi:hypothetical protein